MYIGITFDPKEDKSRSFDANIHVELPDADIDDVTPVEEEAGLPEYCTMCGNMLDDFDEDTGLLLDQYMGYGSKFDECTVHAHLCCKCTDAVLGALHRLSKHPVIIEPDGTPTPKPDTQHVA